MPESVHCNVPITAIASSICGSFLVFGQGQFVKFKATDNTCNFCLRAFDAEIVLGILTHRLNSDELLVLAWGGSHIRVFVLPNLKDEIASRKYARNIAPIRPGQPYGVPDRIISCALNNQSEGKGLRLAIVTAHNVLSIFDLVIPNENASGQQGATVLHRSSSNATTSLLYSAAIKWLSEEHLTTVCGTAFGEIMFSSWRLLETTAGLPMILKSFGHVVFRGHDGSIFGLDVHLPTSPSSQEAPRVRIASCSDDRRIKVWGFTIQHLGIDNQIWTDPGVVGAKHEDTRSENPDTSKWAISAPVCLFSSWAHASRIWTVHFVELDPRSADLNSLPGLVSCGEDATCQLWELDSPESQPRALKFAGQYALHTGKNIWTASILNDGSFGVPSLVTGGADGAAFQFRFLHSPSYHLNIQNDMVEHSINHSSKGISESSASSLNPLTADDSIQSYDFVDSQRILLVSKLGRVLQCELSDAQEHPRDEITLPRPTLSRTTWRYLAKLDDVRLYSLVSGLPSMGTGFIGGSSGNVYAYCRGTLETKPIVQGPGKIAGLFSQAFSHSTGYLFVTWLGSCDAKLYKIENSFSGADKTLRVEKLLNVEIPAAAIVTCISVLTKSQLCVGFRNGRMAMYRMNELESNRDTNRFIHDHKESKYSEFFFEFRHQDAVTSMIWYDARESLRAGNGYLLTTSRDGTFAIQHLICTSHINTIAQVVHNLKLPFGPYIEGATYDWKTCRLVLHGFHGKDFVEYDETGKSETLRITCGGAHRVWAFQPTSACEVGGGCFVWTKTSKLNVWCAKMPSHRTLQQGGHGREIKACAVRPNISGEGSNCSKYIATGAEDTDIRIFEFLQSSPVSQSETKVDCITILSKHNTGVINLAWSADGSFLFSSGGSEEFFVWKVQAVPYVRLGVLHRSQMPFVSDAHDLRVTDFDIVELEAMVGLNQQKAAVERVFRIVMSFSDSSMRVFLYKDTMSRTSWELLYENFYGLCCLTQVAFLNFTSKQTERSGQVLITAGTDGHVAVCTTHLNEPGEFASDISFPSAAFRTKVHQNTIKCLRTIPIPKTTDGQSSWLAITAGDDNALAFTRLDINEYKSDIQTPVPSPSRSIVADTLLLVRAHAASITALLVRNDHKFQTAEAPENMMKLTVTSVSNDQRVKRWLLEFDISKPGIEGLSVKRVASTFTSVADAATICTVHSNDVEGSKPVVVICGIGMEILNL